MRNFFKKIDETVREMWLGTFLWGCLCELVSKNLLRYAVVLVVFAVLMLTHFADPLAAFAGLMGMKASAYLQPFIRGYKEKKRR